MIALVTAGCSLRAGDFTALSTHNVGVPTDRWSNAVEGSDCVHYALGLVPLGWPFPSLEKAVDRALGAVPESHALQNAAIYEDDVYLVLWGRQCVRVRGEAVRVLGEKG